MFFAVSIFYLLVEARCVDFGCGKFVTVFSLLDNIYKYVYYFEINCKITCKWAKVEFVQLRHFCHCRLYVFDDVQNRLHSAHLNSP